MFVALSEMWEKMKKISNQINYYRQSVLYITFFILTHDVGMSS